MRIGIVCHPTYGGSGALATELGQCLARLRNCVHIISYQMPFRLSHGMSERVFFHEVPMSDYAVMAQPYYSLNLAVSITQIAEETGLDVLHVHYAIPHAISGHLAREMLAPRELPLVTTLHGTDITLVGRAPAYKPIVRFSIEQSDRVTAVSSWLRDKTMEEFTPDKRVEVIHNFIDTDRFRPTAPNPAARRRLAGDDEKILMHISNFRPVKRLADVVEVFARVAHDVPSRLILIGDGPEREARVVFLGKQMGIESLLALADLFLFPSDHESFGLAPAEAMACEVPVIASCSGGLPEVIEHGETGFLHPVGDVDAMADCALRLLRDDDLSHRVGRAARQSVAEKFSPQIIVPRYLALYREICDLAGRPHDPECDPESETG
jgi:N-acetyl-alpha-D-glucosaminyl L-malate synthase BshA